MLAHELCGRAKFLLAGPPSVGQSKGSFDLLRHVTPPLALQSLGQRVRRAQREGIIEERECLQWRGRGRTFGSGRRRIGAIERVEQRVLAAACPEAIDRAAMKLAADGIQ